MKLDRSLIRPAVLVSGLVAGTRLLAQDSPYDLEKTGWFVRTGAYLQGGMSVSVNRVTPTPPIISGIYDNGFVQPDISQGAQGLTWNWGYQNEAQIIGDQLELSRVEGFATPGSLNNFDSETIFGPEIIVGFDFYQFQIKRRDARFGFELGFRFGTYSGSDQSTVQSDVLMKRDRYDLGGIVPPLPPYSGLPNVAGPLISQTPQPQGTLTSAATSTLHTSVDADFYTARFGAWLDVPLSEKWQVGASAGFTSIYAYGTAHYSETENFANPLFTSSSASESSSRGDWLPGVYFQLRAAYRILPWMSAYGSVEWATNGTLRIDGLDYQTEFDFGSTYGASLGLQFSF